MTLTKERIESIRAELEAEPGAKGPALLPAMLSWTEEDVIAYFRSPPSGSGERVFPSDLGPVKTYRVLHEKLNIIVNPLSLSPVTGFKSKGDIVRGAVMKLPPLQFLHIAEGEHSRFLMIGSDNPRCGDFMELVDDTGAAA